jgi:hypothetical protein
MNVMSGYSVILEILLMSKESSLSHMDTIRPTFSDQTATKIVAILHALVPEKNLIVKELLKYVKIGMFIMPRIQQ